MLYVSVVAVLAVLAGVAALSASSVPLEVVNRYVGRLTTHGSADALLLERYARAVLFLRVSGALSIAAGAVLALNSNRVAAAAGPLRGAIAGQYREVRRTVVRALRTLWTAERIDLLVLALVTGLGLALRIRYLFQPLAFDEALTYGTFAARPLLVTISHYAEPNNHIFHSVLVHLACAVFGDALWVVRLPALIAGLLVIPASYVAFRLVYGRGVGLLTAGLVASLPPMLEFSVYARGYSLITLCFVVLLGIAAALLRGAPRLLWLPLAAVGALGFYTVPTMLYPFGVVICWMAMSIAWDRSLSAVRPLHLFAGAALTLVLAALLYLPVAVVSGPQALVANRWVASVSWTEFASTIPQLARAVARHWHQDMPAGAPYLLAAAFAAGLWLHGKSSAYRIPPVAAAVIWLVPTMAIQRVIPFVRTWVFLVPLYAAVVAAGVNYLARWVRERGRRQSRGEWLVPAAACLLALWLGGGVVLTVSGFRPAGGTFVEAPDLMAALEHSAAAGERVLVSPAAYIMFRAYARLNGFAFERYAVRIDDAAHGLVVVNEAWNETLSANLLSAGVSHAPPEPHLLLRVGTAAVYRW